MVKEVKSPTWVSMGEKEVVGVAEFVSKAPGENLLSYHVQLTLHLQVPASHFGANLFPGKGSFAVV